MDKDVQYKARSMFESEVQHLKEEMDIVIGHDLEYGMKVLIERIDGSWVQVQTESFSTHRTTITLINIIDEED